MSQTAQLDTFRPAPAVEAERAGDMGLAAERLHHGAAERLADGPEGDRIQDPPVAMPLTMGLPTSCRVRWRRFDLPRTKYDVVAAAGHSSTAKKMGGMAALEEGNAR